METKNMSLIPKSTKFDLSYDDLPERERLLSAEELENVTGGCQLFEQVCKQASDCCSNGLCKSRTELSEKVVFKCSGKALWE